MKLDDKEFKRFKELQKLIKSKKATEADKAEFAELQAKRNERGSNDLAWWKNYPELLKDVTNIAFNWIPGTGFPITGPNATTDFLRFGLVAKAVLRPSIGKSVSDSDPFNSQMRRLWLDMHRKYRGIGTYEKSDLGMMIIAVNSAFETVAKFERIYGVINTYKVGNRTVPYALKEALGISDSLEANLADFRYQLNLRISKLQQLCLPKGLSVLQSDIMAIANVFKDAANRRAFLFLFDTDLYGVYSATAISTGGCVKFCKFSNHQSDVTPGGEAAFTLPDIMTILDHQINALLNDDDIARMCSDLIAAYGPENVMQMMYLPEDYKVEPVQDYERSLQFHNLTICGDVCSIYEGSSFTTSWADGNITAGEPIFIYQDNNVIHCELGVGESNYTTIGSRIYPTVNHSNRQAKEADVVFDTWVDEPGETEVMCGSRFTAITGPLGVVDATHWTQTVEAFGTKICTKVRVYHYQESSHTYAAYSIDGAVYTLSYFRSEIVNLLKLTQCDWAPMLYLDNSGNVELFGDIDNATRLTADNLNRLHEVALLSGYYIPMVSRE